MPCLTNCCFWLFLVLAGFFFFIKMKKNSIHMNNYFIHMNNRLNRSSISVFSVLKQRKCLSLFLFFLIILLFSKPYCLLAIQNPRLKIGYLSYKSEIFVIFFQIYTIISVQTSAPFFNVLASFGAGLGGFWGDGTTLTSIQFLTSYHTQEPLWVIRPFLLLRNDLWKGQHFKSVYAICICSTYSHFKKHFLLISLFSVLYNTTQKRKIASYRNAKVWNCIWISLKQMVPSNCAWILDWMCSPTTYIILHTGSRLEDLLVCILTPLSVLHIVFPSNAVLTWYSAINAQKVWWSDIPQYRVAL